MAKAIKLDMSKLKITTVDSERRVVTSDAVQRPKREILATINQLARDAAWAACLETVVANRGAVVEAKGASWKVNDDELAQSLRVNYNVIQTNSGGKMDKAGSRSLLTQIFEQLEMDAPEFLEDESENDSDK